MKVDTGTLRVFLANGYSISFSTSWIRYVFKDFRLGETYD
jgi:hypothetical protein